MTDELSKKLGLPQVLAIVFAGALLLLVGYSLFANKWGAVSVAPVDVGPAPVNVGTTPDVPRKVTQAPKQVMESIESERRAMAKARLLELSQAGDAVGELIDQLHDEIAAWTRDVPTLLYNDDGKRLAADEQNAEAFRAIFYSNAQLPSPATPNRLRELLKARTAPLVKALATEDAAYTPSDDLATQIAEIGKQARVAIAAYRNPRRQIESLVQAARRTNQPPAAETLAVTLDAITARRQRDEAVRRTLETGQAEEVALARAELMRVMQLGHEIEAKIDVLDADIATWTTQITPLLTNDAGRLLAGDDVNVEVFQHLYYDQARPTPSTARFLRDRLETQLTPVRAALNQHTTYSPSQALVAELHAIESDALQAIIKYGEPREQIQGMLAAARRDGTEPASFTLQEAVTALKERAATDKASLIAAAVAAERKAADKRIAELEAQNEREAAARDIERRRLEESQREKAHEDELTRLRLEEAQKEEQRRRDIELMKLKEEQRQEAHLRGLDAERKAESRRASEAGIDELRKRAADPAVQAKYQPFLEKGRFRFRTTGRRITPTQPYDYPKPASLNRLREVGALQNAACFWETGMALPGSRPDKHGYQGQGLGNDRPAWTMNPASEEDWKKVEARFNEFIELAPFWVESESLQP